MQMEQKGVDLKGAIEKVITRARAKEISDNVIIEYLIQDKGFDRKKALATIKRVNRKNLRSAIKSLFASVEDITNISEQEAELVKELLKYDRATTRADKAIQKKAKQELLAQVRVMARVSKGKISAAQLSAVISRLTRVNLSRQSSIDSFVDYMRKVFSDADYAQKLTGLKSKIKQAKKNIRTKVGIGQDGLTYELENLLNIDPSIIPDDVFTKYEKLVTSFGEKKTVLSLPEATQVKQDVADINDALNTQNSLVGELTERFNSFEDKKTTEDGKVEYAATVKRMLKDKVITEEESKLMTKFSKEINPREEKEGKSEEQKQKEMEEEKKELIQEVKDSEIDTSGITNRLAKQVAESLSEMIKTEAINELSNPQLKNLIKAIDNINSGYVNHYSQLAWENLMSTNFAKTASESVNKSKPLKTSRFIAKMKSIFTGKSDIATMIERTPLFYMDAVLGDFTSKKIFESIIENPAQAMSTYQTDLQRVYDKLEAAESKLAKSLISNRDAIIESKYKQMAYMVQLEHESNIDNKQTRPASEVMKATITRLERTNQKENAKILKNILDNDKFSTDGEIDLNKIKKSFSSAEKNMIKAVQEVNASLTEKAVFTAGIIRGEAIDPLNNYIHQQVLSDQGSVADNVDKLSESFTNNAKPSTKAKNLIERVSKVSPINFDILSATKRGAKMTLMDFHLTSPLRVANKTLSKMNESIQESGEQREIFEGIKEGYNQAIKDVIGDNFTSSDISTEVFDYIAKTGYRTMLVGLGRMTSEFLSNVLFTISNPKIFIKGVGYGKMMFSSEGSEIMNNVRSKQTQRLYGSGLSGRLVDPSILSKRGGTARAQKARGKSLLGRIRTKLGQAGSLLSLYPKAIETGADVIISSPDKMVTRPIWFGTFATEFSNQLKNRKELIMETAKMRKEGATDKQIEDYIKKETEVDFNKIAENDAEYMSKYKKEIEKAKREADTKSVEIGATDNPLMGILKNKKRPGEPLRNAWKNFNGFMQRFLIFEFNAFRKGLYAAIGRGEISKLKGGMLMAAVVGRMTAYTLLTGTLTNMVASTLGQALGASGDDDDEEDKKGTTSQKVARAVASTTTSLLLGRSFGAGIKAIQNRFIELANKEYGDDIGFRDGEYDRYNNSIAFDIFPESKSYKQPDPISDLLPKMLGPYSNIGGLIRVGARAYGPEIGYGEKKKTEEGEARREKEKDRFLFEVGGNLGLVPLYKELRKAMMKDIYKDLGKKDEKDSSSSSSRGSRGSRGRNSRGRKGRGRSRN